MVLNKIYKYYGIPTAEAYAHMKEKYTEAFTGFDGVQFETVEATDDTAEQYKIYLDSDKSMWLTLYTDSNAPKISIGFKAGTATDVSTVSSSSEYRRYNIVRTSYGVMFSNIGTSNNSASTDILADNYLTGFFAVGEPNVLVYTKSTSNTVSAAAQDIWHSSLHDTPEAFSQYGALYTSTVPRTKLFNASSMVQPIDCEHLYRLAYSDGTVGKIELGDKHIVLGTRYALEYDPSDDGKEV